MTSVLQPEITSIINGFITINVRSASVVAAYFDQLLLFSSSSINGPFTQITVIGLVGADSYSYLDVSTGPDKYYKAQFFNSGLLMSGPFSELAQETGVFSDFSIPTSTATYPPEIALAGQDREIVESIRVTIGDMGSIERDFFDSSDPERVFTCSTQISEDGRVWELSEPRGWPRRVVVNGVAKTSIADPRVLGYKFLEFAGSGTLPVITGSLDVYYDHFRFSDREILLAYDRGRNLLIAGCQLREDQISLEMRVMQAAILLLEGELRDLQSGGAISITDGDTRYDNTAMITARTLDLDDLKQKLRDLIRCTVMEVSMRLEGVRLD